ncbi:MAG: 3'-5' exonuclease [Clostridium sp.]
MQLKDRLMILVDTETTGFSKDKHQLLEVGILVMQNREIKAEFEVQIKHKDYTVTTSAMSANKIDLIKHEETALTLNDAAEEILKFLKEHNNTGNGYIFVGQNVQFDIGFLEKMFLECRRIKEYRDLVSYRNFDLMHLALTKNLEGKIELEKLNLDTILTTLGIEIPENRHRALQDCYLEFEAINRLLDL